MQRLKLTVAAVVFAVCALVGASSVAENSKPNADKLVDEALAGSVNSAKALIAINKDNESAIRYWRVIAAENGDPVEQYNLWFDLSRESSKLSKKRAVYWLKRAAASGDRMSRDRLGELQGKR